MKYIVDRIEGEIVIAIESESEKIIKIDKSLLNFDIYDGLVINYNDGVYSCNEEETKKQREDLKKRFDKLKEID